MTIINKHKSDCCGAEVRVVGGNEGTNHWECKKCGKLCNDVFYVESKRPLCEWFKENPPEWETTVKNIERNSARKERERIIGLIENGGSSKTVVEITHNGEKFVNLRQLLNSLKE